MGSHFHVHFLCLVVALTIIQGIHGIKYVVTTTPGKGGSLFRQYVGYDAAEIIMTKAINFVWVTIFKQFSAVERKNVQEIHLILKSHMSEKSSYEIDGKVHEIHLSTNFIRECKKDKLKTEITALIFYEMTHLLQWTTREDQDSSSKDVVAIRDGVAAFVVLMAHYQPKTWVQFGEGDSWNQRRDVTAQFLVYCNGKNPKFVPDLNKKMSQSSFSTSFFLDFFNKDVEDLWKDYKHAAEE